MVWESDIPNLIADVVQKNNHWPEGGPTDDNNDADGHGGAGVAGGAEETGSEPAESEICWRLVAACRKRPSRRSQANRNAASVEHTEAEAARNRLRPKPRMSSQGSAPIRDH